MAEPAAFAVRYHSALAAHAAAGGELGRAEAYSLGREAVGSGMSLLELAIVHNDAQSAVLGEGISSPARDAAMEFYLEAISTFDMAQRGYLEAQERARIEHRHAERLARLNEAVVAVSARVGHAERCAMILRQSLALFGSGQGALFVDGLELVDPPAGPQVIAELRSLAAKTRANEVPQVRSTMEEGVAVPFVLTVPLGEAAGRPPRGTLALCRDEAFSDEEVAIAEQFTRYGTLALDMATRLEQEHEMSITLQRALLPPAPPPVAGLEIAWRYLSAEARDIGGDWYDVFNLDNGDVVLVVGDVMGHDLRAAAIMGQLRLALQAYAIDGHSAPEVVDRADRLLQRIYAGGLATLAYVVIDADRRGLRLTNAGHPPPVLLSPDGGIEMLTGGLSVPLGTDARGARHREAGYPLEPGSRLLLYTDGLVEDRTTGLSEGFGRLVEAVRSGVSTPAELCERALEVRSTTRHDDLCIICVAVDG